MTVRCLALADAVERLQAPAAEAWSVLTGAPLLAIEVGAADLVLTPDAIATAVRRLGALPCPVIAFAPNGPAPAVRALLEACDVVVATRDELTACADGIGAAPLAAATLVQVLRAGVGLAPADGLVLESLAYATLQAGPEFGRCGAVAALDPAPGHGAGRPARARRGGAHHHARPSRPPQRLLGAHARCAGGGAGTRRDRSVARGRAPGERAVLLQRRRPRRVRDAPGSGDGPPGADDPEPGAAPGRDRCASVRRSMAPAWAPASSSPRSRTGWSRGRTRSSRSPRSRWPHSRAGGTVSLPRRIGRQRTAYLALSGRRLDVATAHAWGLVDAVDAREIGGA